MKKIKNNIPQIEIDYEEAIIYTRVSSERQKSDGHGLDSQELRCRTFADREGLKVVKVFKDTFSGGGDFWKRPAMKELLQYVDDNPHKRFAVIFDDLSRFARDTQFHLELRKEFYAREIKPLCLNFNFSETEEGRFIEIVMAARNEYDRIANKRQVVQKMKARLEAGYWPFGSKKGYTLIKDPVHGKLAVPNKEGLEMLKPAAELFATGVLVRKIDVCNYLVEKGFWKNQTPDKYTDKLTTLLIDPFYCGDIEYSRWGVERRKGKHEAIISKETYELIKIRLNAGNTKKVIRKDVSHDFPLRGLIVCSECKRHLTATWTKGRSRYYPYYFCQNKGCGLYCKTFSKKDVESDFEKLLNISAVKPETEKIVERIFDRAWELETDSLNRSQKLQEQQIKDSKEKVKRLLELVQKAKNEDVIAIYESDMLETAGYIKSLEYLRMSEKSLDVPYRTALNKTMMLLKNPISIWNMVDTDEKQRLFFFIFDSKLEYDKIYGYRTAESRSIKRLFNELVTTNSHDVEVGEVNPRPNPALKASLRRIVPIEVLVVKYKRERNPHYLSPKFEECSRAPDPRFSREFRPSA